MSKDTQKALAPVEEVKEETLVEETEVVVEEVKADSETPVHEEEKTAPRLEEPKKFIKLKVVNCNKLNVREGAGLEFPVIAQLSAGSILTGLDQVGAWFEVYDSKIKEGFVHEDFVELI